MKVLFVIDNYRQVEKVKSNFAMRHNHGDAFRGPNGDLVVFCWKLNPERVAGYEFDLMVELCDLTPAERAFFYSRVR